MHASLGSRVVGLARLALFAVHAADVDDAAPALFHHVGNHLLGHVEHAVQIGFDHGVPVLAGHLQEHAVAGDTSVVHQHINGAMLSLGLGECLDGRIPVAHVAHRCVKGEAQGFLLCQPLGVVTRGATAGDDLETIFVQTLADSGTNATHATGYIRYFLAHAISPCVSDLPGTTLPKICELAVQVNTGACGLFQKK